MAIYKEDIADINLETGNIHRSFLRHSIGTQDQHADHFGIRVMRDGEPVDLTGISVQGVFMPPQGSPIAITGDTYTMVEGNVAKVILPQACYNYEGSFTLAIKLIDITDSITGTIRIIDGVVDNTHASGTVAPTGSVPTYQEILAVYADMVTALITVDELDDEVSDLKSAIITVESTIFESENIQYSTSATYPLGFRSGYFSSTGISKSYSSYPYSRNADGIVINSSCKKIIITPQEGIKLNYCIFSEVPDFSQDADNSSILLANGGGFITGEQVISDPPVGLLYVSYNIKLSDLTVNDLPAITVYHDKISAIDNDIQEINDEIIETVSVDYIVTSDYPLGFRSGYFSSTGTSKAHPDYPYSRNAVGIVIDSSCKKIIITPQEGVTLNYCIFSEVPDFSQDADNSSILLANGGGFITGERIINNPVQGLLYVSHNIAISDITENNRPGITIQKYRFSLDDKDNNSILGYTRNYADITWQLNFERKQITTEGITDSTTHVLAKLPNIGSMEIRMNTPAGKFAIYKDTNGTITQLCNYTTYQYRIFADYVSDYYVDITNINVTTLTIANARKYVLAFIYNDVGIIRQAEYSNKLYRQKIAFIGDSITQGRYHETGSDEDVDGTNMTMSKPYPVLIGEICGDQSPGNYGIGGALVYNNDWKSLYLNCSNVSGYDVVFVHAGTNDYGSSVSASDFESAYQYVLSVLKSNNSRVVVLTPVFRTNRTSANNQNMYLIDYVNIEKSVAESESCEAIDLYSLTNNGLFKHELSDGLHPNEIGHMIIANLILGNL